MPSRSDEHHGEDGGDGGSQDLIAAVLADHAEIKELFATVGSEPNQRRRRDAFDRLVRKLAVHETAEEEVVHPLARKATGGERIVEARLEEEHRGNVLLFELERMGVYDPGFDEKFEELRQEVLAHAEHEEKEEHPRLRRVVTDGNLARLGKVFRLAEKTAPTHAHPHSPDSATGNLALGPMVAMVDRVRDALRKAMHAMGA